MNCNNTTQSDVTNWQSFIFFHMIVLDQYLLYILKYHGYYPWISRLNLPTSSQPAQRTRCYQINLSFICSAFYPTPRNIITWLSAT